MSFNLLFVLIKFLYTIYFIFKCIENLNKNYFLLSLILSEMSCVLSQVMFDLLLIQVVINPFILLKVDKT